MRFCEASAKDNFNVDEIFLKLVDDIISKVESEWKIYEWMRLIYLQSTQWEEEKTPFNTIL